MSEEVSYLSTDEASRILRCTKRTIVNYIRTGRLSADKDSDGFYRIQKSEFYRVFPEAFRGNSEKSEESFQRKILEGEVNHLREMIEEKNKHNEFLQSQLQLATNEKGLMLEALSSNTKLLARHDEKMIEIEDKKKKKFILF